MKALDDRALAYIRACINKRGYAPTVRELARYLEMSSSGAHGVLNRLVNSGKIERDSSARAIRIRKTDMKAHTEEM